MANFFIGYYGGGSYGSPEEDAKGQQRFMEWAKNLGDAMINPGTPLGKAKRVSSGGVADYDGPQPLTGYSIVKAETMDAALEMAKSCPFVEIGVVDVAEVYEM